MEDFPISFTKQQNLVFELCNHKNTRLNIIHKAKILKFLWPSLKPNFEKFLKKTEMNPHVIIKNRNQKMLHTGSPN